MKAIYEYPENRFIIADIIHLTGASDDEVSIIFTGDMSGRLEEVLFDGMISELAYTKEGFAHNLCNMEVKLLRADRDGKLILYV